MYLKKLDMYGFKSFMDRITVSFDYAITAIVGPNGSGKSNITDAIRWVLGEQSIKSLRGSRMEDVIFAGTAKHKPVSFAEVSLTLDNTSGLFSSPYSEITVTRRVYRSGESEYFINKTPCRLRDIHELFMDTGLGRDGYSVISQGQIDSILSQKSEDRRQIFEEAAGISKYKYKKNEAMRKLATTEENLVRVRDIAGELASRLGPLETQAKKAREYLDIYEKLKILEINLSVSDIEKLQKAQEDISAKYALVQASMEKESARLSEIQTEEASLYDEMRRRDGEMESVRALLHTTDLSVKGMEGDNALLSQRMETELLAAEKYEAEKKEKEAEIEEKKAAVSRADEAIKEYKLDVSKAEQAVSAGREKLAALQDAIHTQTASGESLTATAAQLYTQAEETGKHIEALSGYDLPKRRGELEEEIALANRRMMEYAREEERIKAEKEGLAKALEEDAAAFSALAAKRPKAQEQLAGLKAQYNETMRTYNQKLSRKNALSDMEQNMEGYQKGVRSVLRANLSADIRGVLSKLIHTEPKFVLAIETALGGALQNIVVGTEEDAKRAIAFLKQTKEGRATFLPISAMRGSRLQSIDRVKTEPGVLGLACDLVTAENDYAGILLHLLGTTVVVDTVDNAISLARKFSYQFRIVTEDGTLLNRGGAMTGGSRANQSGLLSRSGEISALEAECASLSKALEKAEDKIDAQTDALSQMGETLEALRTSHGKKKATLLSLDGSEKLCLDKRTNEENHLKRLASDLESTLLQMENADKERQRLETFREDLLNKHKATLSLSEEAKEKLRSLMDEQSRSRDALAELQVAVNSAEKDLVAACNLREELLLAIRKLTEEVGEKELQKRQSLQTAEDLRLRHANRLLDIEEGKKRAAEFAETLRTMTETRGTAEKTAETLRQDLQVQNDKLYALQGENARLEAQLEKTRTALEGTISHLWDSYELTYSSALEHRQDIGPIGPAKEEAARLRRALRALGSVNVDAVTEYQEVKERHSFLSAQIQDLETAMQELQKIIMDMTRVMTETFSARFAEIAEHFKETFRTLFGGGTGKLTLTDPGNILESGIEIDVQPPGKKLQNLSLLSGGEKALTAIAILFSVLRVRPAPFCILDEIESALDDHNIDRFAAYLRNYADTQFIIVTHRRGTMEAADVLYGVTMQEKGVSKLLSMQISDIHENTLKGKSL